MCTVIIGTDNQSHLVNGGKFNKPSLGGLRTVKKVKKTAWTIKDLIAYVQGSFSKVDTKTFFWMMKNIIIPEEFWYLEMKDFVKAAYQKAFHQNNSKILVWSSEEVH